MGHLALWSAWFAAIPGQWASLKSGARYQRWVRQETGPKAKGQRCFRSQRATAYGQSRSCQKTGQRGSGTRMRLGLETGQGQSQVTAVASQDPPCCSDNLSGLKRVPSPNRDAGPPPVRSLWAVQLVECKSLGLPILQSLVELLGGVVDVAGAHWIRFRTCRILTLTLLDKPL